MSQICPYCNKQTEDIATHYQTCEKYLRQMADVAIDSHIQSTRRDINRETLEKQLRGDNK